MSAERSGDALRSHGPSRHAQGCSCIRCRGFQPGHEPSRRHGGYSLVSLQPRAAVIADELRRLVPARSDADEPAIRLLALQLAQVEGIHEWLAEHGFVDEGGQPRGILRHLGTVTNTAARLCDRLGLTPSGRAALGLDMARARGEALRAHLVENCGEPG